MQNISELEVKQICALVATDNHTLKAACASLGINPRTFQRLIKTNEDYSTLYAAARYEQRRNRRKTLVERAETALERALNGRTVRKETYEVDREGGQTLKSVTVERLPVSDRLLTFVLERLDKRFGKESSVDVNFPPFVFIEPDGTRVEV